MLTYFFRRALFMLPILFGVTLLTFCLFNVFGGDPARRYAGKNATIEQVASIRTEFGLDRPLTEQYLTFVKQIVSFDYGRSWASKQSIRTMIMDGLGATLALTVPSFIASVVFCLLLALVTLYWRGTWVDHTTVVICLALMSISSLVYVVALQYFLGFRWGIFPISGWDPSWSGRWLYLQLPWIIMFALSLGPNILVYRAVMSEELDQDYIRTARAKGLNERAIFGRHLLKNALIPIITIIVIEAPVLITGSVLIEVFFGIPGLGGTTVKALHDSDFPVIKAFTVISAVSYMFFSLLADLLYVAVDPRVKLS